MSEYKVEKQGARSHIVKLVVIGLIILVVIIAVVNRMTGTFEKVDESLERDAWPVNLMTVKQQTFSERITASAILQPMETADLTSEVAAKVKQIKADLGDRVKKGRVMVRLDGSAYYLNLQAAKAQLAQAEAQQTLASDQYKRMKSLFAEGHISEQELDTAESNAKSTLAGQNSALAQLDIAKRNMGETTIRAPFSGRVSSRSVSPGNLVSPGVPIISLVQDDVMKVELALAENEIKRVKPDMTAEITVPSIPGKTFFGKVTRIGVAADRTAGSFPVRVEIENKEYELLGGMRCSVDIVLESIPDAVVVTRDHIIELNNQKAVFIAQKSNGNYKARFSPVEINGMDGQNIRLLSGVNPGDLLVVVGQQSLKDGSRINPVEIDGSPTEKAEPDTADSEDSGKEEN